MRSNAAKLLGGIARAFALAAAACLLASAAQAQEEGEVGGELWPVRGDVDATRDPRAPFELSLNAPMSGVVCRGDALGLEVEVRNPLDKPYEFEKSSLWKLFTHAYHAPKSEGGLGEGGQTVVASDGPRETVVIAPGEALRFKHEFSLKDKFFKRAGNYSLMMWAERVTSPPLKFEIMDCGQIEPEEK